MNISIYQVNLEEVDTARSCASTVRKELTSDQSALSIASQFRRHVLDLLARNQEYSMECGVTYLECLSCIACRPVGWGVCSLDSEQYQSELL